MHELQFLKVIYISFWLQVVEKLPNMRRHNTTNFPRIWQSKKTSLCIQDWPGGRQREKEINGKGKAGTPTQTLLSSE
jgi:hypothetical protein